VERFATLTPEGARVLDLAAGGGRNGRPFLARGHAVTFVDRDTSALQDLRQTRDAEVVEADLETGAPVFSGAGPLAGRRFGAILVVNYLHRPLLVPMIEALAPGGVLIYDTFAVGNEAYGRPKNPDFLLKSSELLALVQGRMQIVAFEQGTIEADGQPAVKQRIAAVKLRGARA
jgi:SAM-dependent methyltransferase